MSDTATGLDTATLATALARWMPEQRWFAGKQRPIESVRPRLLGLIATAAEQMQIWVADVVYADAATESYQVPLRVGAGDTGDQARIGEVLDADGQPVTVYDAMWDRNLTQAWLIGLAEAADPPVDAPAIDFHLVTDVADIPLGELSRVLTGEQSNTSAVFGNRAILKVFRRLEIGENPDIEIHEALGRLGGSHIARLFGYVTADFSVGLGHVQQVTAEAQDDRVNLAMLQDYLSTATDGWELAKISVRDLMAEGDLHAEEAGGDFAAEAFRLGVATAQVHADLAEAFGRRQLDRSDMVARAGEMSARLDSALELVPQLVPVAEGLRACYAAFAAAEPITVQRVHGDLHLGQVLRSVQRWVLLDFEGEPVKSIAARRDMDSPLRDVAGMLRSFDYAANHQVIDSGLDNQRRYRAAEWADRNRSAFQTGYTHASGVDHTTDSVLSRAFEADKAVYEAVYEARNRPAWLGVPLASLGRLARPAPVPADREDLS